MNIPLFSFPIANSCQNLEVDREGNPFCFQFYLLVNCTTVACFLDFLTKSARCEIGVGFKGKGEKKKRGSSGVKSICEYYDGCPGRI